MKKWKKDFFGSFSCDELIDLVILLRPKSSVTVSRKLGNMIRVLSRFRGYSFWEAYKELNDVPYETIMELSMAKFQIGSFGELCDYIDFIKETIKQIEWARSIDNLKRKHVISDADEKIKKWPRSIYREDFGKVFLTPHSIEQFKKRASRRTPDFLVECFLKSSRGDLSKALKRRKMKIYDPGSVYFHYTPEFLRFVVVSSGKHKWTMVTIEEDYDLARRARGKNIIWR